MDGYRHITVKDGVCTLVGCDGPEKKEWTFVQNVTGGQMGTEMVIDFSPKGGPKDLLAKWDAERNGIAFPDGNLWSKLSHFQGSFSDPNHMDGYRHITVKDGVATLVGCDGPEKKEWTFV
jgi:hypothetical protein